MADHFSGAMKMRIRLWLIFIVIALIVVGAAKTVTYLRNLNPTTITVADYLKQPPSASWINLTKCDLRFEDGIALETRFAKIDKGTLIPIDPIGASNSGKASLVLFATTEQAAELFKQTIEHAGESDYSLSVQGMILGEFDSNRDKLSKVLRGEKAFASEVTIIELGAKPDVFDIILFIVGIVAGVAILKAMLRKKPAASPPPLSLSAGAPPPLPPRPSNGG